MTGVNDERIHDQGEQAARECSGGGRSSVSEMPGQVHADVAVEQNVPALQRHEREAGACAGVNLPLLVGSILLATGILLFVLVVVCALSGCAAREPRLPGLI